MRCVAMMRPSTAHIDARSCPVRAGTSRRRARACRAWLAAFLGKRRIYPSAADLPARAEAARVRVLRARRIFPGWRSSKPPRGDPRRMRTRAARGFRRSCPYIDLPEGVPLDQWAELNKSRRWSAFFLWRDGVRIDAHADRCPRTAALLAKAPDGRRTGLCAHGVLFHPRPQVAHSAAQRRHELPPHRAPAAGGPVGSAGSASARRHGNGARARPGYSTTPSSTKPGTTATCRGPCSFSIPGTLRSPARNAS